MHRNALKVLSFSALISAVAGGQANSHDLEGMATQAASTSELPPPVQTLVEQRERLRDPAARREAIERALSVERPADVLETGPMDPGQLPPAVPPTALDNVLEQVGDARARWQAGETIRVCFLNGSEGARQRFMQIAAEVISLTNLSLDERLFSCGAAGAQVHVSFEESGNYSYVGTDALFFPESTATLNLMGMGAHGNWPAKWIGTARHEIGHMLSMKHEHQHPGVECGFKTDGEIAQLLGWDLQKVRTNFGPLKEPANLLVSPYDPESVMHYRLSEDYFQAGTASPCYIEEKNVRLSNRDKAFLTAIYRAR